MKTVLAILVALGLATPAAGNDVSDVLAGIIVGAVVVDALNDNHHRRHHAAPLYVERFDPYRVCRQEVEYVGRWIYVYDINCHGDLIRVTQEPNW